MASVCGGSLSLMSASAPLKAHVAELQWDRLQMVVEMQFYDILGLEDHLGDMDFKVAGTREGVTATTIGFKN